MKTVFNNRQLAHVWAQQNQESGRGSHFYFDGPTIYSYGPHFPIARFIHRGGSRAVLVTTRRYSVTTAKHCGYVLNALHGIDVPQFNVSDIDAAARGADSVREDYRARVTEALTTAAKARKAANKAPALESAGLIAAEANRYAEFVGQDWRITMPRELDATLAALREEAAKESARKRAAELERNARRAAEYAEALREWRANRRDSLPYVHDVPTALRCNGPTIQTSRGAEVPVTVARLVWDAVTEARTSGVAFNPAYHDDKPRLGAFTLDHIDTEGNVRAGCHTLPFEELQRMAVQLGLQS